MSAIYLGASKSPVGRKVHGLASSQIQKTAPLLHTSRPSALKLQRSSAAVPTLPGRIQFSYLKQPLCFTPQVRPHSQLLCSTMKHTFSRNWTICSSLRHKGRILRVQQI